jgi:hypothetical protein
VHLRLDTINYDQLILRYRPVLRFDAQGNYWNASAATFAQHRENKLMTDPTGEDPWLLFEHSGEGDLGWGLETLVLDGDEYGNGAEYPDGSPARASESDYIDANGDHKAAADAFRFGPYDNIAYSRTVHDASGRLWLQYWFFYYFNEQNVLGVGDHEGDWEMVQFRVNETGTADAATYAQHNDTEAEACLWSQVEKVPLNDPIVGPREAPVVYVAARSQASYFIPGLHQRPTLFRPDDQANGNGEVRHPALEPIGDAFPIWPRWPGRWGSGESPASPGNQQKRWSTPNLFHSDAGHCANLDGSPR